MSKTDYSIMNDFHFQKQNPYIMKRLFFITGFSMIITLSFSQWNWQNPSPHGHQLNDVKMISPDTIIAVGDYGTIMRSVDGGNSWITKNISGIRSFDKVCFPDKQNGWAVGTSWSDIKVFNTVDKGENWILQSSIADWCYEKVDACFPDDKNGWLTLGYGFAQTTNGGETWEILNPISNFINNGIFFIDSLSGWVVGREYESGLAALYNTIDGGESWTKMNFQLPESAITDIFFINNTYGWIVVNGWNSSIDWFYQIYKTQDGGSSWVLSYESLLAEAAFNSLIFSDLNNGWAIGWGNSGLSGIIHTSDAGNNWSYQSCDVKDIELCGIDFINETSGVIVGTSCIILKTEDEGNNWIRKTSGNVNIGWGISFPSQTTGFCVGDLGAICKTTDGGVSWSSLNSGTDKGLYSACFLDSQTGWAAGSSGMLLHTDNGGLSWSEQFVGSQAYISSVDFTDVNNGWAIQGNGTISSTQDGGVHWNFQHNAQTSELYDVFFFNNTQGWAVGYNYSNGGSGLVLMTSDGGSTWNNLLLNDGDGYFSAYFIDELNGWIAGTYDTWSGGIILHTSDGGQTWQTQYKTEKCWQFNDIRFVSPTLGWVVGDMGVIFHTANGGQTWNQQESGTNNWLNSVSFTDANNGWVSGRGGTILHTNNGGVSWIQDSDKENTIMLDISPNPFRDELKIQYKLKSREPIIITLFDMHGRVIQELYQGTQDEGEYCLTHNFSELHAGPYLIKFQSRNGLCTRKVIKY